MLFILLNLLRGSYIQQNIPVATWEGLRFKMLFHILVSQIIVVRTNIKKAIILKVNFQYQAEPRWLIGPTYRV